MEIRGLGSTVVDSNLDEKVLWCRFCILYKDIKVFIFVEYAGIDQLIFRFQLTPAAISLN